ncbi:hypothetical protein HGA88_07025 [Candidatus Roizmanbacteria bacterium]|nr:hypothetical protein [Candidatus Roizmanbacteria bacterium]
MNKGIYHIYNRTLDRAPIFNDSFLCSIFLERLSYYLPTHTYIKYSLFHKMKNNYLYLASNTKGTHKHVDLLAYCIMPNHFHLLVKQNNDNGVSKYLSQVMNSFTKYYNIQNERNGSLFHSPFKCVEIRSDEQLLHVSRYIHLNPYTASIVQKKEEIALYPWSSFSAYINGHPTNVPLDIQHILSYFQYKREWYSDFVINNSEYQKRLHRKSK